MATTLKKLFVNTPGNLRLIRPLIWREIQRHCADEFKALGIIIPDNDEDMDDEYYSQLSSRLQAFEYSENTAKLADILVGLDEFSSSQSESFYLSLSEIAAEHEIEERFMAREGCGDEQLSIVELAVLLMLSPQCAARFRGLRSCLSVDKSTFDYYNCLLDDGVLKYEKPTAVEVAALADKFKTDSAFKKKLKIKDFCIINMFEREAEVTNDDGDDEVTRELIFNISRSNRPVVTPSVKSDALETVSYTPPTTDIVIFNPVTRQVRTNSPSKVRRAIYLAELAKLVYRNELVRTEKAENYTYAPLEQQGWQALFQPAGITGLAHVRLKEVEQDAQNEHGQLVGVIVRAPIRRSLADYEQLPNPDDYAAGDISNLTCFHNVRHATFEFVFEGEANKPVVVKIRERNRFCIKQKQHAPAITHWLSRQGFIA